VEEESKVCDPEMVLVSDGVKDELNVTDADRDLSSVREGDPLNDVVMESSCDGDSDAVTLGDRERSSDGVTPVLDGEVVTEAESDFENDWDASRVRVPSVLESERDSEKAGVAVTETDGISLDGDGDAESLGVTEPIERVGVLEGDVVTSLEADGDGVGVTLCSSDADFLDSVSDAVSLRDTDRLRSSVEEVDRVRDVVLEPMECVMEIV
jgi:hypothetical protein